MVCTDAATFTNLIVGCNHAGKYDQAFQVFDYMRTVQLSCRLAVHVLLTHSLTHEYICCSTLRSQTL